ncbi:MAG: TOBE domain-containing protein, partial [Micropruina glycogenica]
RIVEAGPVRDVLTSPRSNFAARMAGVNLIAGVVIQPGVIRTYRGSDVFGMGGPDPGTEAIALFAPTAVSVDNQPPHGSPRNVIRTTIAELEIHGSTVRVRGTDQPDGSSGLCADITPAAVADLDLTPGQDVYFAVKTMEVQIHSTLAER